jgi:hypothetical protein
MKTVGLIIIFIILIDSPGCIVDYVPANINEDEILLVVEGLITDQPGINTIKLSKSQPLWKRLFPRPLTGCIVSISDNLGQTYNVTESANYGTYNTDPASFRGVPGRSYTLHIRTTGETENFNYESLPVKMVPVPSIDNLYYEKHLFARTSVPVEGCNIYLNTHDPSKKCKFYRWEYSETWEFHLPFDFPNNVCWISNNPREILIKNASDIQEASVIRHPVISIPNPVDRLSVKYSILVNQFSLNEDEYLYWERLKNTIEQGGGLYDLIPTTIPNNIYCLEEPDRKVLGYFSVSAMSSKRLFIKDSFSGINGLYYKCYADTIVSSRLDTIPGQGTEYWVIIDNQNKIPPKNVVTYDRGCVDCTVRGTNIKPAFWDDDK